MDLAMHSLKSIAAAIVEPTSTLILITLSVIFYFKNRRNTLMQKMIMGDQLESPLELTLSQIVLGIFAGTVGSIILTYLGVAFNENSGIELLFLISILLMFYKPRLFCFSYSASILGFLALIINAFYSMENMTSSISVNVVALMTFVGVLHILEGILVAFDGHKGSIPVFSNKNGKISGGFALKRYWPMPVALLFILNGSSTVGQSVISTPSWWPLIQHNTMVSILAVGTIQIASLYGVIGYSSYTFTMTKREKCKLSGVCISLYGIALTAVAQIADIGIIGQLIVLVFAPIGHELMLHIQRKIEDARTPLYISDENGICILEVLPNSVADELNLRSGDRILTINNNDIPNEKSIYKIINESSIGIQLEVKKVNGKLETLLIEPLRGKRLGVILVPKAVALDEAIPFDKAKFQDILDKLKKTNKK
ncbi:PDZ domain-containing protein [Inconstantimicrobium mannanitabidum]|uniref:Membrane protein n=1 Tax=Inconstantimicrobium mannanitabidum TaxID=1604901 RepID=A0ACB5RG34_9CLOT|nr:PDZ domain-containing protein [Clostridium sp. TW13]GKX68043.1 membrane protein [Clostridium sp. TW13]